MNNITLELGIIFILVLLNGFLAMSEIAVVSARKIRLQQRAEMGNRGSRIALKLAQDPGHFLSTVQVGITLVGIFTGAFGGATIAEELEAYLRASQVSFLSQYSEAISVTVVVIGITYFSLILGEIAPKQIALTNPEGIAANLAPVLQTLSRLTSPVVRLLSLSSNVVLRLLGVRPLDEPQVTEEEIKLLIEQGTEGGIFEPAEEEMVQQIFRLADKRIVSLMTPRLEIDWIDLDDPVEAIKEKIINSQHSYFPVAQGNLDNLVGVVPAKDLLAQCLSGQVFDVKAVFRPPLFLPEVMSFLSALDKFQENLTHMAFVIDEFGGVQGLVTTTDILEAIAGDFPDTNEVEEPEIIKRDDGSWLLDGMLSVDEFKDLFEMKELPLEDEGYYQTLGGFVMAMLGRIPESGDSFEWENLRLEVLDMDGHRVDKVLAAPIPGPKGLIDDL